MTAAVVVGTLFALSSPAPATATWAWSNPKPQGCALTSVDMVDAAEGWAVGDSGTIMHTADGSQTWTSVAGPSTERLVSVSFADPTHGWALEEGGGVLRTVDSGSTWTRAGSVFLARSLQFVSPTTGWAASGVGVYKTVDGGLHWSKQNTAPLAAGEEIVDVHFVDAMNGWAVGERTMGVASQPPILRTTDGGTTWQRQTVDGLTNGSLFTGLLDVTMRDLDNGIVAGRDGTLLRTADGGEHWSVVFQGDSSVCYNRVVFGQAGVYAIGVRLGVIDRPMAIVSRDGGATWDNAGNLTGAGALSGAAALDGVGLCAVGDGGQIWRFAEDSQAWQSATTGPTYHLTAVHVIDEDHIVAVGYGGAIVRSFDGGATWSDVAQDAYAWRGCNAYLVDVDFVDDLNGWAVGLDTTLVSGTDLTGSTVLRTRDGGRTWQRLASPNPGPASGTDSVWRSYPLLSVDFIDAYNGWAVGGGGRILHTTDGGQSWTPRASGVTSQLNSVLFYDGEHGVAVGDDGVVLTTSDRGESWIRRSSGAPGYLISVAAGPAGVLVAVGERGTVVRSIDNGATWSDVSSGVTNQLSSVGFTGEATAWISGHDGVVLRSTDAGRSWARCDMPSIPFFRDMAFTPSGVGFAVGYAGTIMRVTNDGAPLATAFTLTSKSGTLASYADPYTLAGRLGSGSVGLAGERVVLQRSTDGIEWIDTSVVGTTSASGGFALRVVPTSATRYRAAFVGDDDARGSYSNPVSVRPRPYVGNPVAPERAVSGRGFAVYGTLKPGHDSASYPVRVYAWRYVSGQWKPYGFVKARASGTSGATRYSAQVTLRASGRWRLRAFAPADSGHASAWSRAYEFVTVK